MPDSRRTRLALCLLGLALGAAPLAARAGRGVEPGASPAPLAHDLSVLTYNTRGLRDPFADDDPEARFRAIGRLVNAYDVALLQEDFAYHGILAELATHQIRRRGNAQDRNLLVDLLAPIVCGDCGAGLSALVKLDESSLIGERREAYGAYSGWFRSRLDGWVTKGLLALRARLPNGAVLDVYNTHLDAGMKRKHVQDQRAREAQLAQLERALREFSGDRALIVAGDFNVRVSKPSAALDGFVGRLGLRESGAATDEGRWHARPDYIFFRSGAGAELELLDAGEVKNAVDATGEPLSDHAAIYARFRIRPQAGAQY